MCLAVVTLHARILQVHQKAALATEQLSCICMQAAEDQQGLQASDLKAKVLKEVVAAKRHAKPDINTSIYRHNQAKGPNPMAFKKKKRKEGQCKPAEKAVVSEPKEKRARKRRKVSQNQDATKAD